MNEARREPLSEPDLIAAEHIIASARYKSKDWTNVYLVPVEQYRAMAARVQAAEQQVARLREAADTLTCAVCKLDMQRAMEG